MRILGILAFITLILAAAGFVYLLHVADQMAPAPSEQRIEVDVTLPR